MSPIGKRLVALGAILAAGGVLAYFAFGRMEQSLVYYWTPDELIQKKESAKGVTVRLGGMVEKGSLKWDSQTLDLRFNLAMTPTPGSSTVAVHSTGSPPQMFQEGIGAVVEGQYDGELFQADRVMVKHSNEYQPPAHGERPQDLYGHLVGEKPLAEGGAQAAENAAPSPTAMPAADAPVAPTAPGAPATNPPAVGN